LFVTHGRADVGGRYYEKTVQIAYRERRGRKGGRERERVRERERRVCVSMSR